jgi:hypothetical protein
MMNGNLEGAYKMNVNATFCINGDLLEVAKGQSIKVTKSDEKTGKVLVELGGRSDWWLDAAFERMATKKAEKVA